MSKVLFINRIFGTDMWVDESRIDEYKAAGHTLAAEVKPKVMKDLAPEDPKKETVAEEPKKASKPKKAPAKRTTKK